MILIFFELPQQSLSSTADHDPYQDAIVTPTKRLSCELSPGDPSSEEVPSAQLSTTKLQNTLKLNEEKDRQIMCFVSFKLLCNPQ